MTLLKLTVPGVPDVYQGDELESLNLVDPDNRRPVDWARAGAAREPPPKLHVIKEALALRRRRPFGEYRPSTWATTCARSCAATTSRSPFRCAARTRPSSTCPESGGASWTRRYPFACSSASSSRSFACGACTVIRIASSKGRTTSPRWSSHSYVSCAFSIGT